MALTSLHFTFPPLNPHLSLPKIDQDTYHLETCKYQACLNDIDQAERLIPFIKIPEITNIAFKYLAIGYALRGDFKHAFEIINEKISSQITKDLAYEEISQILADQADFSSALPIVKFIDNIDIKDSAYMYICKNLINRHCFMQVLEIVDKISDQNKKDFVLA